MKRRAFIAALGGAAAWPLVARGQQTAMPMVGLLNPASPGTFADELRAFHRGLKDTGYVEGENVAIIYRWAENQSERLPALADDLVRRQVAVIATIGSGALVAKSATTTIPIVFISGEDPIGRGLVASLARPGGNLTGINFISVELAAKRLELLRELVPAASRVAVLVNPAGAAAERTLRDIEPAARAMGLQVQFLNASSSHEINTAFESLVRERADALFVGGDPFFSSRRAQLVNLASRYAVPATFASRDFAVAGGLMSYGGDITDAWRRQGIYAGNILKGATPADLPVVQALKLDLVINVETARMLGVAVSPSLLARADEVIE